MLAPLILVPVIVSVVMPALVALVPRFAGQAPGGVGNGAALLGNLPPAMRQALAGYTPEQAMLVLLAVYSLAPLFLLLPFMIANVIAADSIAGERERKTLEALLYSPVTDGELFMAKTLAAWVPALFATLGSFLVYAVVLNAAAWPTMGRVFFPNAMWVVLVLWVSPAVAGVGLGAMVLVSSRVRAVQEAIQLSGLLVLPLVVVVVLQVRGSMMLGTRAVALAGSWSGPLRRPFSRMARARSAGSISSPSCSKL